MTEINALSWNRHLKENRKLHLVHVNLFLTLRYCQHFLEGQKQPWSGQNLSGSPGSLKLNTEHCTVFCRQTHQKSITLRWHKTFTSAPPVILTGASDGHFCKKGKDKKSEKKVRTRETQYSLGWWMAVHFPSGEKMTGESKKEWILVKLKWLIINAAPVELYDKLWDSLKEMKYDTLL